MDMYFVAIVCPPQVNERVLKWKLWMKEKYNCEVALRSPAHITLIPPFWMKPDLEEKLMSSLASFSNTVAPFPVELNGFSNFLPRVIFLNVVPHPLLPAMRDKLFDCLLDGQLFPIQREERAFHPHVTIATRDLYKKNFYEAWEFFKEKKFETGWMINNLSLLRHDKKNWNVIATFQFQ